METTVERNIAVITLILATPNANPGSSYYYAGGSRSSWQLNCVKNTSTLVLSDRNRY